MNTMPVNLNQPIAEQQAAAAAAHDGIIVFDELSRVDTGPDHTVVKDVAGRALGEPAAAFKVGDKVRLFRNLDHPAWKRQEKDPYDGSTIFRKVEGLDELIGETIVQAPNPRYHRSNVVLAAGFEFDAVTGEQLRSGATRIEVCES